MFWNLGEKAEDILSSAEVSPLFFGFSAGCRKGRNG
jgi:hypothetical protein